MNCHGFSKQIGEFYDHRLPQAQRETFENHLRGCPACQNTLRQWGEITALARSVPEVKAPESFESDLRHKIRENAGTPRRGTGWQDWIHWQGMGWRSLLPAAGLKLQITALAGGLILLAGIVFLMQRKSELPSGSRGAATIAQVALNPREVVEPAEGPETMDVLLRGTGQEQVIIRLPSTIQVDSPYSEEYYIQNVSY